ncbi:MAG TPA: Maf family protein [Bryobacteraceae bacterium]|nr:Maf family protein [Bryobacteraceae bacterium]
MLILASGSPRRREILQSAGIEHVVRPVEVDESVLPGEDAAAYVRRLARAKAEAVDCGLKNFVLGADTVVVVDGLILGKPADHADACRMLNLLAGREHEVITGICLRRGADLIEDRETTRVCFVPLSAREIEEYAASGEPMDKAGAYAIQGLASKFVERVEGCYFNVVGLPVARVYAHLKRLEKAACGEPAL